MDPRLMTPTMAKAFVAICGLLILLSLVRLSGCGAIGGGGPSAKEWRDEFLVACTDERPARGAPTEVQVAYLDGLISRGRPGELNAEAEGVIGAMTDLRDFRRGAAGALDRGTASIDQVTRNFDLGEALRTQATAAGLEDCFTSLLA